MHRYTSTGEELVFQHALAMFCFYAFLLACLFLFVPLSVQAADEKMYITEIMFDPPGTDSGHEWVEVKIVQEVDWSKITFIEDGVKHKLSAELDVSGQAQVQAQILSPGSVFVIADDPSKFRADHPSFGDMVFNSTFSLKNTGETIGLAYDGEQLFSVEYNTEIGAKGDGNSLQSTNGLNWFAQKESPGMVSSESQQSDAVKAVGATASTTTATSLVSSSSVTDQSADIGGVQSQYAALAASVPDAIKIRAVDSEGATVKHMRGVVGAPVRFNAKGYGLKNVELAQARFVWNFGDGAVQEGQSREHIFAHPGTYQVSVTVSSRVWSATETISVVVDGPTFFLRKAAVYSREGLKWAILGSLILTNGGKENAVIDGFRLTLSNSALRERASFKFDEHTYLAAKNDTHLSFAGIFSSTDPAVKRLLGAKGVLAVTLEYPNGRPVNSILLTRVETAPLEPRLSGYQKKGQDSSNVTARICHYE